MLFSISECDRIGNPMHHGLVGSRLCDSLLPAIDVFINDVSGIGLFTAPCGPAAYLSWLEAC